MPLPSHLYHPLCDLLLRSGRFDRAGSLHALFVRDDLHPWQARLPEADSTLDRVERTVAFLDGQYTSRGENALVLLLQALREQIDVGDALHDGLALLEEQMVRQEALPDSPTQTLPIATEVTRRPGLIVAVSPGARVTPAQRALEYYAAVPERQDRPLLKQCWLLTGPGQGSYSSTANAGWLQSWLAARKIGAELWQLQDADDVEEVFQAVQTMVQVARYRYRLDREQLVIDYTGGTKSMTAGMILAALVKGVRLQYLKPQEYDQSGRALEEAGASPRLVDLGFVYVEDSA